MIIWFQHISECNLLQPIWLQTSYRTVCRELTCDIFKLNIKWWDPAINSLAPGRCGCNLNWIIFKLFSDRYLEHFLWNCPQVNTTRPHWWLVNIGAGNGSGAFRHQAITWAILCMRPANGRCRYNVTSSLIGWVHTQNYPCIHCPL